MSEPEMLENEKFQKRRKRSVKCDYCTTMYNQDTLDESYQVAWGCRIDTWGVGRQAGLQGQSWCWTSVPSGFFQSLEKFLCRCCSRKLELVDLKIGLSGEKCSSVNFSMWLQSSEVESSIFKISLTGENVSSVNFSMWLESSEVESSRFQKLLNWQKCFFYEIF